MTRKRMVINEVIKYFEDIRKQYPDITDDMLDTNGAIHYMNGNDGTDFDWEMNDRLCEFYVFHKNEYGFIKVLVYKSGKMNGYVYLDNGFASAIEVEPRYMYVDDVETLYDAMFYGADYKNIWDEPIDNIDFE